MGFPGSTVIWTTFVLALIAPVLFLTTHASSIATWAVQQRAPSYPPQRTLLASPASTHNELEMDNADELMVISDRGIPYFSPTHAPAATIQLAEIDFTTLYTAPYSPITVVHFPVTEEEVDPADFLAVLNKALASDDVITKKWLKTVVLLPQFDNAGDSQPRRVKGLQLDWDLQASLQLNYGIEHLFIHPTLYHPSTMRYVGIGLRYHALSPDTLAVGHVQGPFLASRVDDRQVNLWPVYRLYSDTYRTFLFGVYKPLPKWPIGDIGYKAFRKVDERGYNYIPVPSRLYGEKEKALHGKRIGVKDIYNLHGVVTSGGSRAFGDLYGAANETAFAVAKLEHLGAVIVGKTKTATFALGSIGNPDTIDEQYPFSARSDGWQTCWGSSSGSACAMGAYDWLDFGLGSDTGGSVRGPAAIVGLYGNRPSTGAIPLDGVLPLFAYSDTAGMLARDPVALTHLLKHWYQDSPLHLKSYPSTARTLYFDPAYLKQKSSIGQGIIDDFINNVVSTLGMQKVEIDIEDSLSARNVSKEEMTYQNDRWNAASGLDSWEHLGHQFRLDYAAKNGGREPPMDPDPRAYWDRVQSDNFTRTDYNETIQFYQYLAQWINDDILGGHNDETCSKGILVYDISQGGDPRYREAELNAERNATVGLVGKEICPAAGCVDITIPIGQAPFNSSLSKIEEMKAVTVNLVARRGCDFMLLDFIDKLAKAGLVQTVKTGRTAF